MAANLRIKFESGMIVILLTAPRLVEPLAHKLLSELLCRGLPDAHDPVTEHSADRLVLPKPTHLTPQARPLPQQDPLTGKLVCGIPSTHESIFFSLSVTMCNQTGPTSNDVPWNCSPTNLETGPSKEKDCSSSQSAPPAQGVTAEHYLTLMVK